MWILFRVSGRLGIAIFQKNGCLLLAPIIQSYWGQSRWGMHMENFHSQSSKPKSTDMDFTVEAFLRLLIQFNELWIGLLTPISTMYERPSTINSLLIRAKLLSMIR